MNVIDEEGRIVFGPPIAAASFTVGRPFPTTLYNWRLQVALTSAEELGARSSAGGCSRCCMVGLSCVVVIAGMARGHRRGRARAASRPR